MKALLIGIAIIAITATAAEAKRTHVRVYKQATPRGGEVALVAIPPLAVAFDLVRRTTCDPALAVSNGPGDPGFDPKGPKTGNFLIPAIWSRCGSRPQPK